MNKTLYNSAMNKITMSNDCENQILEAVELSNYKEKKYSKKFRIMPIIAAATVLVIGTIGVAAESGGFNWIKGFFNDKEIEMTEDIANLVAEVDDFSCDSPNGLEMSPVGMLADETTLYCIFNIESLPENTKAENIGLLNFYANNSDDFNNIENFTSTSTNYSNDNYYEENRLIIKISTSEKSFHDGDKIEMLFIPVEDRSSPDYAYNPSKKITSDDATRVSFNINFENVKSLEVNYEEYTAVTTYNTKFFIDNMLVTPLKIATKGTKLFYDGVVLNNDLKVIMNDDTVVTATWDGMGIGRDSETNYDSQVVDSSWSFEEPINPDNISAIYLNELCLYKG